LNDRVLKGIVDKLSKKGIKILLDEELVGESGIKHRFSLVIVKEKGKVVFDFLDHTKPSSISALATYIKAFDVKAEKCFLIVEEKSELEELKGVAQELSAIPLELVLEKDVQEVIEKLIESL